MVLFFFYIGQVLIFLRPRKRQVSDNHPDPTVQRKPECFCQVRWVKVRQIVFQPDDQLAMTLVVRSISTELIFPCSRAVFGPFCTAFAGLFARGGCTSFLLPVRMPTTLPFTPSRRSIRNNNYSALSITGSGASGNDRCALSMLLCFCRSRYGVTEFDGRPNKVGKRSEPGSESTVQRSISAECTMRQYMAQHVGEMRATDGMTGFRVFYLSRCFCATYIYKVQTHYSTIS